jgi:nucleoside-diphosphate-sugar epimerase
VRALVRGGGQAAAGPVVAADLTAPDTLAAAASGVDLAVHCAAVVSNDLEECRRTNVQGTQNLVDALIACGCRLMVHVSTISAYDDAGAPNFDEDSPLWTAPADPYGFTKAEAERVVRAAASRGLSAVVLRPGLVASMHPRSHWGPLAVARAGASDHCILPFPEIPYVHVDNLGEAIVLASSTPAARGRAYNVVEGVADTAEYLAAIYGAAGRPAPPVPPDAPRLRFRAERIRRELDWTPLDRWPAFIGELRALRSRSPSAQP